MNPHQLDLDDEDMLLLLTETMRQVPIRHRPPLRKQLIAPRSYAARPRRRAGRLVLHPFERPSVHYDRHRAEWVVHFNYVFADGDAPANYRLLLSQSFPTWSQALKAANRNVEDRLTEWASLHDSFLGE